MRVAVPAILSSLIAIGLKQGTFDSVEQARARRTVKVEPKIADVPVTPNTSRRTTRTVEEQEAAYAAACERRDRRAERLARDPGMAR